MGDSYFDNCPNAKRMNSFAEAFLNAHHQVSVIAPREKAKQKVKNIKYLPCPMLAQNKKSGIMRLISQLSFAICSLFVSLKAGKADVVITTTPPALISPAGWLISKFKRAFLIYDVRDIWPDVALEMGSFQKGSIYERLFRFVRDFMLKRADLVTAVSLGKVKKLSNYKYKSDVIFITNGFDKGFLKNEIDYNVVNQYNLADKFSCVYVGKIGLAQNLKQLLDIAELAQKENFDVQFLLFGTGVEEKQLKNIVAEKKINNVIFCGKIPNSQVYTILKKANMCFVPLVNKNLTDSIPTKLYEALGVGCPVLLSACGDSADILNKTGLGIAVTPNDTLALWKAFCEMYKKGDWSENREKAMTMMNTVFSRQNAAEILEKEITKRIKQEVN
jgi:glycosyltransferase involved in cell wall biosynthesis